MATSARTSAEPSEKGWFTGKPSDGSRYIGGTERARNDSTCPEPIPGPLSLRDEKSFGTLVKGCPGERRSVEALVSRHPPV
jgi:hypothetical protein